MNFFLQVSLCFWPIVQTINFRLIPQYARVVFVALACFLWANILSMQSNKRYDFLKLSLIKMNLETIIIKLKSKIYFKFFQVSCCFWLPAQFLNFRFVPETFRVVYIGAAAFIWVNLLSICKTKGIDIEGKIKKVLGIKKE